jgi:hypothetical protein
MSIHLGLFIMVLGWLFVGTVGSALAILWTAAIHGHWPEKDTIWGLIKIFYGIGALSVPLYLLFKFG